MTKVDIISGFLGAGKTTLIKKLLTEALEEEKVVLIENEFGQIGIDSGFLKEAGIQVTEMNSGCICCSLVGDFGVALRQVLDDYAPQRILIEPSGVGKLSDVIAAVERVAQEVPLALNSHVAVVDGVKCKLYTKNFGEFFNDQVAHASAILLSRTQSLTPEALEGNLHLLHRINPRAPILTTPWDQLTGRQILDAMPGQTDLSRQLLEDVAQRHAHPGQCNCGHEHNHEHCQGHGHNDEHDQVCACGEIHNAQQLHPQQQCDGRCGASDLCDSCLHNTFHHHADEVFASWGRETPRTYSREELQDILASLSMTEDWGVVLRAKGMVPARDEAGWLHFDLVPGEFQIRSADADVTGRLCVIGVGLKETALETLFLLA